MRWKIAGMAGALLLTACAPGGSVTTNTNATAGSGESSLTDVKRIVSTGVGINFNALVGTYSQMAVHPTTKLPVVVYYDRSTVMGNGATAAGALKYAYMNAAGDWTIEVVDVNTGTAACGAAASYCVGAQNIAAPAHASGLPQVLDVKFTAGVNGGSVKPIIAYVFGNNAATGKRIRVAERNSSTGLWAISDAVPTTGIPAGIAVATLEYSIKGLNLLIDSSDRPHIYAGVYTTTYANSKLMYTMRKSDGTWTTFSNVTAAGFTFVSAGTLGAATGVTQAGAAMCPADNLAVLSYPAGDNLPATSNQPWLLKCSAVDASGTCTAWSSLDLVAGCGGACFSAMAAGTTNAGQTSDLVIDPATNKILFAMYSTAIPNTQTVAAIQPGGDTCAAFSATAWTAQAYNIGTTPGVGGVRVAASSTNSYLALINGAATPQLILAQTGAASLGAAWSAGNSVTVESNTALRGPGVVFDSTNDLLWTSFGIYTAGTAGAVGHDLKVSVATSSDIVSTGFVNSMVVDQTQGVFPSTAAPVLAAARAPNGTIGFAYFFTELGAAPGVNSHLYYGVRGGPTSAPVFGEKIVFKTVQGAGTNLVGAHPSIDFDSNSNPVISFLDAGVTVPANTGALMVARSSNGGAYFTVDRVDGVSTTNTVGRFSSVKVHSDNTVGVAYYDFLAANLRLKFAKQSPGGVWKRFVVDGLSGATGSGCSTADGGSYASLAWTSSGRPVIAYQSTISAVKYLRLAYASEAVSGSTYNWTCLTLDSTGQGASSRGEGVELVLDSSDKPHVVHLGSTDGEVRYVTCSSDVATCVSTGVSAFSGERVALTGSVSAISSKPAIRVDSSGKRWVTLYSSADRGLILATKALGGSSWSTEQIESDTSGGLFVSAAGQYGSLLLNSSGQPMIFYRSIENWLKYFSRELL